MKATNDVLNILRKTELFEGISNKVLFKLAGSFKIKQYKQKEVIFAKNNLSSELYIVLDGFVKIYEPIKNKKRAYSYVGPAKIFGEFALLGDGVRVVSAEAVTDITVIVISKNVFFGIIKEYPAVGLNIACLVSAKMQNAYKEIVQIAFLNLPRRIALLLLNLCTAYGKKTKYGRKLALKLNHNDIAELAGTTRETVVRVCSKLRKLNHINYYDKNIEIIDEKKIMEFIDNDTHKNWTRK
ncbi:MAG: hypothetical protein A2252_06415 [Elusimicrobia bacterium RIFOXYA2_FULL_39_19]|nr:MAG: hypothetical protein A2252_06415 [Elusimicrobia bacterium RIFOXYA2_FULL_39_19]